MSLDKNIFYQPNIAFYSGSRKEHAQDEFVREHVLAHVIAGELRFTEAEKDSIAQPGETKLFRRNLLVKCEKRPAPNGQPFKIVYFVLENEFLRRYALKYGIKNKSSSLIYQPVIHLQPKPPLLGLLQSIYPYFESGTPLGDMMMHHKLVETTMALLCQDENIGSWLFDAGPQSRIELADFMEKNYMFNVPMTKFAELTGRSLSTFQRDFRKIFGSNAAAWLLKRRLKAAYESIVSKKLKPVDIYLDLGFEDISHFSRSFKQEFGFNPSQTPH